MTIKEIEDLIDSSLESGDKNLILGINKDDITEELFGDAEITDLVKKYLETKDDTLLEKLREIHKVSVQTFSKEDEVKVNMAEVDFSKGNRELKIVNLLTNEYEKNVEDFNSEYSTLVKELYKNKDLKSVYSELKEIEMQFSKDVARLVEISITDPSKIGDVVGDIKTKITECYPYKTKVKFDVVENFVNAVFSKEEFEKQYEVFKNFISSKSLRDIKTIQANFCKLNVVDLTKYAMEGKSAEEVMNKLNPGKRMAMSFNDALEGDVLAVGNNIHEVTFCGTDSVKTKMYPTMSAYFADEGPIEATVPVATQGEVIKQREVTGSPKAIMEITEGREFTLDSEKYKGKIFKVLVDQGDGKYTVSDGTYEYELTIRPEFLDKIKFVK